MTSAVLFPEILTVRADNQEAVLTLRIPENLAYFAGHFEEIAVVAGVVQIQWAVFYAQQYLGLSGDFFQMEVIKFKELLLPQQQLELRLSYQKNVGKLNFCYQSATAEYSSGRLYFHDDTV